MPPRPPRLRSAEPRDAAALGRMGAALARMHHETDRARFFLPGGDGAGDDLESGYGWWLGKEIANKKAVVVVAETARGRLVGYAYGRVEGKDWNKLLDRHGELVDLWVEPGDRRGGAGALLAEECHRRLVALGVPRVVLMTAAPNAAAQALFAKLGWRPTMLEMTREE